MTGKLMSRFKHSSCLKQSTILFLFVNFVSSQFLDDGIPSPDLSPFTQQQNQTNDAVQPAASSKCGRINDYCDENMACCNDYACVNIPMIARGICLEKRKAEHSKTDKKELFYKSVRLPSDKSSWASLLANTVARDELASSIPMNNFNLLPMSNSNNRHDILAKSILNNVGKIFSSLASYSFFPTSVENTKSTVNKDSKCGCNSTNRESEIRDRINNTNNINNSGNSQVKPEEDNKMGAMKNEYFNSPIPVLQLEAHFREGPISNHPGFIRTATFESSRNQYYRTYNSGFYSPLLELGSFYSNQRKYLDFMKALSFFFKPKENIVRNSEKNEVSNPTTDSVFKSTRQNSNTNESHNNTVEETDRKSVSDKASETVQDGIKPAETNITTDQMKYNEDKINTGSIKTTIYFPESSNRTWKESDFDGATIIHQSTFEKAVGLNFETDINVVKDDKQIGSNNSKIVKHFLYKNTEYVKEHENPPLKFNRNDEVQPQKKKEENLLQSETENTAALAETDPDTNGESDEMYWENPEKSTEIDNHRLSNRTNNNPQNRNINGVEQVANDDSLSLNHTFSPETSKKVSGDTGDNDGSTDANLTELVKLDDDNFDYNDEDKLNLREFKKKIEKKYNIKLIPRYSIFITDDKNDPIRKINLQIQNEVVPENDEIVKKYDMENKEINKTKSVEPRDSTEEHRVSYKIKKEHSSIDDERENAAQDNNENEHPDNSALPKTPLFGKSSKVLVSKNREYGSENLVIMVLTARKNKHTEHTRKETNSKNDNIPVNRSKQFDDYNEQRDVLNREKLGEVVLKPGESVVLSNNEKHNNDDNSDYYSYYDNEQYHYDEEDYDGDNNEPNEEEEKKDVKAEVKKIENKFLEIETLFDDMLKAVGDSLDYIKNEHGRVRRSESSKLKSLLTHIRNSKVQLRFKIVTAEYTYAECLKLLRNNYHTFEMKKNRLLEGFFVAEEKAIGKLEKLEVKVKEELQREMDYYELIQKAEEEDPSSRPVVDYKETEMKLEKLKNNILTLYAKTRIALRRYLTSLKGYLKKRGFYKDRIIERRTKQPYFFPEKKRKERDELEEESAERINFRVVTDETYTPPTTEGIVRLEQLEQDVKVPDTAHEGEAIQKNGD